MLFDFIKYLQPTHYFSLYKNKGASVFPIFKTLPEQIQQQLHSENQFKSPEAQAYDLSWQAIQKGYIGEAPTYQSFKKVPIKDEYIFISKYFNRAWVVYVLIIRLLSFKNPMKEINAWYNSRHVKRSQYLKSPITYSDWKTYKSGLIQENPLVSVVIPTLNRYPYLKDVLSDLEQQDYTNFEVIVVDQSQPFQKTFYNSFKLHVKVLYQEEKALWLARNKAIQASKGDYLLLFDDDSRVDTDWISNHLKGLDFFKADVSSGVSLSKVGADIPAHYNFFRVSDQLDTGNVLVKKEVFKTIGLFDRQFEKQRMGDGEFGLRVFLHGFLNVSNPYAKRLHLKVDSGGLREMGSWDAFRTKKWFAPKPIPSVLYLFRRYYGNKAAKRALYRTIPMSIMPYQFKKNKPILLLGVFLSILLLPVVVYQVLKSWGLASKKLKQGALIEYLECRK